MSERKIATFASFNPYEGRYPGRRVISREALLLVKRLRQEGFDVKVAGVEPSKIDYIARKGIGELLADPVFIAVSAAVASVALNIIASWLYDLMKRGKSDQETLPDELNLVVEVDDNGKRVRYDHKGREITDQRFEAIIGLMKNRQAAYTRTVQAPSPDVSRPIPVFLEHTSKIVGWAHIEADDDTGALVVRSARIDDDETLVRIDSGELKGFSIAGLVASSTCELCGKDFRDCGHGVDHGEPGFLNRITRIDLCEISVVRDPVGFGTEIRRRQAKSSGREMQGSPMDASSLISSLNKNDLVAEASVLTAWDIGAAKSIDEVARFMYFGGPWPPQGMAKAPRRIRLSEDDPRPERKYWDYVKAEMAVFLCEDEKRYRELWKRLSTLEKKETAIIVGVIAASLGDALGASATLLTGFVAVCLYGALKIGKEAFCRYVEDTRA